MIYVASSWRNEHQASVVDALRAVGHEVFDFRNPAEGDEGFRWSEIDPEWQGWSPERYRELLSHPIAERAFETDMDALRRAEAVVLVQPCGRSSHLELGWAVGAGKATAILLADGEPELMAKMVDAVCVDLDEVLAFLAARGLGR